MSPKSLTFSLRVPPLSSSLDVNPQSVLVLLFKKEDARVVARQRDRADPRGDVVKQIKISIAAEEIVETTIHDDPRKA